ncbi:MAG TPA: AI-2E family transporter [Pseudolabrys sp.]|nr:AI-2E family transporter [Pseudolabrys sp.]
MSSTHETALLLERVVAVLFFIVLLAGVVLVLRPFATAILFGGIIVVATWPIHQWLTSKGHSNPVVASIMTIVAVALVIVPVVALAPRIAAQLPEAANKVQKFFDATPDLPGWIGNLPVIGERLEQVWSQLGRGEIQAIIGPYSATLRKFFIDLGGAIVEGALQIILSFAIAAMLWLRGDQIRTGLENIGRRFAGTFGDELLRAAAASVQGVAYGIVGTAFFQAIALTIGLFVARVPGAGLLGFLALIIALSQIGILLVVIWGGAAWWLFTTGAQGWAIFMIVWGLFVSTIDNVIRPFLVSFGATMPLTLVFLGVLGGFISFGFLGMFIGPTLLAIAFAIFQAWRQSEKRTVVNPIVSTTKRREK